MILIKNANLLDVEKGTYKKTDILTDGKIIKKVGNINKDDFPKAKIIDAKGKTVTPGLVDSHCHIGLEEEGTREAGCDGNDMAFPIMPELRGIDSVKPQDEAFKNALNSGITTVITGPGSGDVIGGTFCALKTQGKTVLDMCIKEEVAMKMALGENPKRVFGDHDKTPMTRMGSAALMREALFKAKNYHDELNAFNDGIANSKKPTFDMKLQSLQRVFDGMPVKIHAHQQDDIVTALRIGKEFNLNLTIEHCTEGYLIPETLKQFNARCILGPTLSTKSKIELKNKSFDSGKILWDNGITFSIMTDHPVIPIENTLSQAALFVRAGMSAEAVLKCLTINAAKMVGLQDSIGSIEEGKDGDIVIWSGDPFHYLTQAETIILNGEIVKNI